MLDEKHVVSRALSTLHVLVCSYMVCLVCCCCCCGSAGKRNAQRADFCSAVWVGGGGDFYSGQAAVLKLLFVC